MSVKGRIHSRETFGTVDGPGIRYVLFMQGCTMRCRYCHNPDTWALCGGREVSAEQIIDEYLGNEAFYSKGGITVTGGEPLLQSEFLCELFSLAHKNGIHTCLDTSGAPYDPADPDTCERVERVLDYTDLVMLDIKHIDPESHKKLTGWDNAGILAFAARLDERKIPIWIRHVVVRGLTDKEDDLFRLGEFIGGLKHLSALDVLPYHRMGEGKYASLGIKYSLAGVEATSDEEALAAKKHILRGVFATRARK